MKKIFCNLILLSLLTVLNAFNFGELKTFTRKLVQDDNADPEKNQFKDVLISSYMNAGIQNMAMATFCLHGTTYYSIISGQREYNFYSDMFAIERVLIDKTLLPQISISRKDDDTTWESNLTSAPPTEYYVRDDTVSVLGFTVLPDTTTYTQLKVNYVKIPAQLVNNSDIPFNGQPRLIPYHYALVFWTASLLCYQDKRPIEGDRYMLLYQKWLKDLEVGIRLNPDYMPSISGRRE